MKKLNNKGFTLTELLATLAVLSLVSTIVIYVAINVVNSAKDKSYLVTRNNVEKAAVSYLEENSDKIHFVKYDDNIEYQCVTVQNLIDTNYFDKDVLNSKISKDKTISDSDYIYIERDKKSRTIKNSKLITDSDRDYSTICGNYNSRLDGDIEFKIPGGYAKEKDVSIKYCLYNVSDYKNIEYLYNYVPSDKSSFIREYDEDNCLVKNIKILSNGELTAEVKDTDIKKSTSITGIDNKAPVIKIEPNGDDTYTKSKTININISDDLSGISSDSTIKYGFSKSKSEEPGSYKEINVSTSNVKVIESSLTGEYYLWIKPSVKDNVGNENNDTLISDVYKFDNTAPSIPTYKAKYRDGSGSYTSGSNANKEVVTEISTTEADSGIEGIYYSKDKRSETKFNFGVSALTQNGSTWSGTESWDFRNGRNDSYYFRACDKAGNCSEWSEEFHIKYKTNMVYIKYHSNGGSMSNNNSNYTVNSTSKLVEYKGNSKFHSVVYGGKLNNDGLYNTDNSSYIKLARTGYSIVSGKEWCTKSDGSGTCYDQTTQYSASDFCDASSSDCEVTLYANWKVNTLTIIYHANDGSLTTNSNNNGYSKNSDGVITKKVNGEDISNFHVIKYNGTIDIYDANNSKGIQLTRTGYSLVSGKEWYKKDSDGNKIYYNQSTSANYSATDICDLLKTGDCTIDLYANWKVNKLTIKYHANGGSLTTNSKNNGYSKNSDGVITKKVNGEYISNFHVVKYGNDVALKWANYSGGIQLTRTGYSIVSGKEWCTKSDGSGTCYDQNPTSKYKAEKMCSKLSSGDCTIDLYAHWKKNTYKCTRAYDACASGYETCPSSWCSVSKCKKKVSNATKKYTQTKYTCGSSTYTCSTSPTTSNKYTYECSCPTGTKFLNYYGKSAHCYPGAKGQNGRYVRCRYYNCPSGYTKTGSLDGTMCVKWGASSCPSGYTKTKEYKFTVSTPTVSSCSTSSSFTCDSTKSGKSYVYSCVASYSCPNGGNVASGTSACYVYDDYKACSVGKNENGQCVLTGQSSKKEGWSCSLE